jgi:hypothetical protein
MQKWRNPKVSIPMYHLLNVHEDFSYYFELGLVSWFQTQPRQGLHNGLRRGGLTKHAATGLRRGGCSIYRRWMQKRWCTFVLSRSKWPRILLGKFVTVFSEWMMSLFNLRFVSRNSCINVYLLSLNCCHVVLGKLFLCSINGSMHFSIAHLYPLFQTSLLHVSCWHCFYCNLLLGVLQYMNFIQILYGRSMDWSIPSSFKRRYGPCTSLATVQP